MQLQTIYVLQLEDGKYYVGKTKRNIEERFNEHCNGTGSEWTKKYKPVSVLDTSPGDDFAEDPQVLRCMVKYGIDNVRGGKYSQITLNESDRKEIIKSIAAAQDLCYTCGKTGHFTGSCPMKAEIRASSPPKDHRNTGVGTYGSVKKTSANIPVTKPVIKSSSTAASSTAASSTAASSTAASSTAASSPNARASKIPPYPLSAPSTASSISVSAGEPVGKSSKSSAKLPPRFQPETPKVTPPKVVPSKVTPSKTSSHKTLPTKTFPTKTLPAKTSSPKTFSPKTLPTKTLPSKTSYPKALPSKTSSPEVGERGTSPPTGFHQNQSPPIRSTQAAVPVRKFRCSNCREEGHNKTRCKKQLSCSEEIDKPCINCGQKGHTKRQCLQTSRCYCTKCGKNGHVDSYCMLAHRCSNCHRFGHTTKQCTFEDDLLITVEDSIESSFAHCIKCNQSGHTIEYCATSSSGSPRIEGLRSRSNTDAGYHMGSYGGSYGGSRSRSNTEVSAYEEYQESSPQGVKCNNCGMKGHRSDACTHDRVQVQPQARRRIPRSHEPIDCGRCTIL